MKESFNLLAQLRSQLQVTEARSKLIKLTMGIKWKYIQGEIEVEKSLDLIRNNHD